MGESNAWFPKHSKISTATQINTEPTEPGSGTILRSCCRGDAGRQIIQMDNKSSARLSKQSAQSEPPTAAEIDAESGSQGDGGQGAQKLTQSESQGRRDTDIEALRRDGQTDL